MQNRRALIAGLAALALLVCYASTLRGMFNQWRNDEDMSHGFAVPLVIAWIVWRERYHRNRSSAIVAYSIQLLLNALWAPLFFGQRNIGLGLFEIVALWAAVGWTLREFARVKFAAGLLIAPYLVWMTVCVAMALSVWKLNP